MTNILVCAFCVSNKDLVDIYNNKVFPKLHEKINYCFGVKIKSTATINKLCIKCARNVDQFASFKAQVVEAKSYLDNLLEVLKNDVSAEVVVELYKKMKSSLNKPTFLTKNNIKRKRPITRIKKKTVSQNYLKKLSRTKPQHLISHRNATSDLAVASSSRTVTSSTSASTILSDNGVFLRDGEAHDTINNKTDEYIELSDSSDSEEIAEQIMVTPDIFLNDLSDSDSTINSINDVYSCSRTTSFTNMKVLKSAKTENKRHSRKLKIKSKEFIETDDDDSSEYGSVLILYPRKSTTNSPNKSNHLLNEAASTDVQIKSENICAIPNSTMNEISNENLIKHFEISSASLKIEYNDEQPASLPSITKTETDSAFSIHSAADADPDKTEQNRDVVPADPLKWFIKTRPVFINGSKRPQYPCHLCRDILKTHKKHSNHLRHNHEIICFSCKMKFRSNNTLLEHQIKNGCLDVNRADRKFYLKPVVRLVRFDNSENKFLNPKELLAVTSTDIQTSEAYLDYSKV